LKVNLKEQVGLTAGSVWRHLSENGPQTLAQLKKKMNGQAEFVNMAVGWLAREDKVDIVAEKRNLRVQLR
jgi:hypothetical protein